MLTSLIHDIILPIIRIEIGLTNFDCLMLDGMKAKYNNEITQPNYDLLWKIQEVIFIILCVKLNMICISHWYPFDTF